MSNEKTSTTRRSFLTKAAGAALATALPTAAQDAAPPKSAATAKSPAVARRKRPLNVLFFMSDDMRPELACYSSRFNAHSPNIDALAAHGVRFDRNYCQFPLCNPSRSSLFTGHIPRETGILGNTAPVVKAHPDWITLPRLFKENGYTTLRSGKLFHAGLDDPNAWTDFYGDVESMHPTTIGTKMDIPRAQIPMPDGTLPPLPKDNPKGDHSDEILVLDGNGEGSGDFMVADLAIKWLNQVAADPDKPFFVGCGFSKPHSPPQAPQKYFDMWDPAKIVLPPDFAAWPTVPPGFPKAAIRPRNADLFIGRGASESEAKQVIRAYLASISWADWNLGRVVAELERLKLRDNTLIVFVADHGYQLGEKGKWSKAGSLFEGGTRIPLIISMPGAKGNGRPCLRMVQSLDVYRTVCELAGLQPPSHVEGTSLVPLLEDPRGPKWDQPAYSIWSEDGSTIHGTAIRTEQWRYAEYGKDAANGAMLLDVHADPMELTNLADSPQHAATRILQAGQRLQLPCIIGWGGTAMSKSAEGVRPSRVTVGVCGGVAAYKAAELVRALQQQGVDVHVVMTRAAREFVQPLTFSSLTGHKVITTMWGEEGQSATGLDDEGGIEHISEAQAADAVVIAPATAHVLAKMANGLADDFLSTMLLATTAPVIVAPAMNVNMWNHPATRANVDLLRQRGVTIVEPGSGYLACGMTGSGRLADVEAIAQAVLAALQPALAQDLTGETILVTAGGTREAIDPVRFLGNRSSGKMGYALAEAARQRGAQVVVVSAPTALTPPAGCAFVPVTSAAEMRAAVMEHLPAATVVIGAAAVADFRMPAVALEKLRREGSLHLDLEPTEDILRSVAAAHRPGTLVIAFAAEMDSSIARAREKLLAKGADAIVLNDVSQPGIGFDSDRNAATFVTRDHAIDIPEMTKRAMADRILDQVLALRALTQVTPVSAS